MGLIKMIKKGANAVAQSMPGQVAINAVKTEYYDTILEYFRCENLSDEYLFVPATKVMRNGAVNKGSEGVITSGSVFDVAVNQAAILIENGRVHDFVIGTTENGVDTTGQYKYESSLEPSCISGGLKDVMPGLVSQGMNAVDRMKFGGQSKNTMRLIYINMKEIKMQKIGIGGVSFYDNRYNLSIELKGHGTFSYKIVDPISFYQNMTYDPTRPLRSADILEELRNNISTVLDPSIGSIESICARGYVDIKNHSHELAGYANQYLVERGVWANRGIKLSEISLRLEPTEESKETIKEAEQAQLYSNPGMAAGLTAKGMRNAMDGIGAGAAKGGGGDGMGTMGAMMGMMGMGMMNQQANMQYQNQYGGAGYAQMGQGPAFSNPYAYSPNQQYQAPGYINQQPMPNQAPQGYGQPPMQPMQGQMPNQPMMAPMQGQAPMQQAPMQQMNPMQQQAPVQQPMMPEQPVAPAPTPEPTPAPVVNAVVGWTCACGAVSQGKFCMECGAKKPADAPLYKCDKCGWTPADPHNPPKFCPECGDSFDDNDVQ